ncbi:hypothetical protein SCP_0413390 [Sparassis crispa]|uniref:REJ domain-containing protein n=1 Tax=Sparassis crispa TaxID=139825 RepID=A0A401GLC7_9APHY|nr:hypothetical protein SCP_0413390 [Sparassis crispa]GBE82952.1 hypothetical protein SCP_0413390 [Sparassis crispa]
MSLPTSSISLPFTPFPISTPTPTSQSSSSSSSSSPSSSLSSSTPQSSSSSSSSSSPPPSSSSSAQSSSSSASASSSSLSSSSASTSSSSPTSNSSSSSLSSTGSTSVPTSSLTSLSSTSSTPSYSTSLRLSTSGGVVVTLTSTVGGPAATDVANNAVASKGFFHNKGAVAGVFTVVGLVVAAIVVALVTTAIRRQRAKKFDHDVALAAAEAAAGAHVPDFTDDDYGYPEDRRDFGAQSGYSDASHGTYAQQPMGHGENYSMSELPPFDPYAGPLVAAGAAGVGAAAAASVHSAGAAGVGAAGVNRVRSMGQKQTTPYNAFAAPPPVAMQAPNTFADTQGPYGPTGSGYGLLEAAGLAGAPGTEELVRGLSQTNANLARNRSMGAAMLGGTALAGTGASSSDHGAYPANYTSMPGNQYGYSAQSNLQQPQSDAHLVAMEDPYEGYTAQSPLPNPFGGSTSPEQRPLSGNSTTPDTSAESGERDVPGIPWHQEDANRMSIRDEEDYGYNGGRRVLKVANE